MGQGEVRNLEGATTGVVAGAADHKGVEVEANYLRGVRALPYGSRRWKGPAGDDTLALSGT